MKFKDFILGLLFICGLCFFLYPTIMKVLYVYDTEKIIQNYVAINPKDKEHLYTELVKYNNQLFETHQSSLRDAWSYKQEGFDLKQYGFKSNMIAIINIDKIDVHLPVYLGATSANMEKGITLLTQTSIPIGGKNTNAVLCGHRGTMNAAMFRDIHKLEKNDIIYIENFYGTLIYKVKQKIIIRPNEIDKVLIQEGKDMITLISCEGEKDKFRYIVYCERELNDIG